MANTINWNTDYVTDCLHEEAHCYGNGDYSVYFWQIDRTCSVFGDDPFILKTAPFMRASTDTAKMANGYKDNTKQY